MMRRVTKNRTLIALYCTSVRTYDRAGTPSSKAASHVFSDGVCRCHWQESNKESQLQNEENDLQLHQEEEQLAAARVDCQAYRAG